MRTITFFLLILIFRICSDSFAQDECTFIPHQGRTEEFTKQVANNNVFSSEEKETALGKFKIEFFESDIITYTVLFNRFDCFDSSTGWERTKFEPSDTRKVTSTKKVEAPFIAKVTFPNGNVLKADKDIYFRYQGEGHNYKLTENGVFVSEDIFSPKFTFEQVIIIISGQSLSESDLSKLIKLLDTKLP